MDRPRRPLRDDDQRVHRVGLVGAAADVGRRSALRGLQGGALLPARRHRPLLPRGRPRLSRRRGPRGLREDAGPAAGAHRRNPGVAARAGGQAAHLDHHALDADQQRGDRRRPRDRVRAGAPGRRGLRRRAGPPRARPRGGGRGGRPLPRRGARRDLLRAPLRLHHRLRSARPHGPARRFRHHRRGNRSRPHRDRLRRGRLPARGGVRDQAPEPGRRPRPLRRAGH